MAADEARFRRLEAEVRELRARCTCADPETTGSPAPAAVQPPEVEEEVVEEGSGQQSDEVVVLLAEEIIIDGEEDGGGGEVPLCFLL